MRGSSRKVNLQTIDLYRFCEIIDRVLFENAKQPTEDDYQDEDYWRIYPYINTPARMGIFKFFEFDGQKFSKNTLLHRYIEAAVWQIIISDISDRQKATSFGLLIDELFDTNDIDCSYWDLIRDSGLAWPDIVRSKELPEIKDLLRVLTAQIFFVLFGNRTFCYTFSERCAELVRCQRELKLGHFEKIARHAIPKWAQKAVFMRDRGHCILCHSDLTGVVSCLTQVNFDHIIPLARGGVNDLSNLQLLCESCNKSKGARSDQTSFLHEVWY